MHAVNKVFLLLGSNIEPRENYLRQAHNLISSIIGNTIAASSIYESEPHGFMSEQSFLNQVLILTTKESESDVLEKILNIELNLDRKRSGEGYSSRTIDIDILYFNDIILNEENLTIPHPRLHERRFTLVPLCEVAKDFIHPKMKLSNYQLLQNCLDDSQVNIFNSKLNE